MANGDSWRNISTRENTERYERSCNVKNFFKQKQTENQCMNGRNDGLQKVSN